MCMYMYMYMYVHTVHVYLPAHHNTYKQTNQQTNKSHQVHVYSTCSAEYFIYIHVYVVHVVHVTRHCQTHNQGHISIQPQS